MKEIKAALEILKFCHKYQHLDFDYVALLFLQKMSYIVLINSQLAYEFFDFKDKFMITLNPICSLMNLMRWKNFSVFFNWHK